MIENTTPKIVPQNPSNTYQISLKIHRTNRKIADNSYSACVVIDGMSYAMVKRSASLFDLDYVTDSPKHKMAYYFDVNYFVNGSPRVSTSRIYELSITNRYAVGFECNRGRPNAKISLLGRGFIAGDRVEIGGVLCKTQFISPNALTFTVPFIETGRHYEAFLVSENGDICLGNFHIDVVKINAEPDSIAIKSGERQLITISIGIDAPRSGLPLEVTTDIPESIIMHDVVIRGGERRANVIVKGAQPGIGTLFIGAPGFVECEIPVEVIGYEPADSNSSLTDDFVTVD
jgi:hypothetical protein